MQFDFLKGLFGKRTPPAQPAPPAPKKDTPAAAPKTGSIGDALKSPPTASAEPRTTNGPLTKNQPAPSTGALNGETPAPLPKKPAASEAHALLLASRTLLTAAGATALAARIQVRWNSRMRSTAGMAYPGKSLVTLNPRLREFGAEEVDRTLRHELAHLLAHERAGRRRIEPHGLEWRRACDDLGLPGEKRTHNLPLPRRNIARRHHYRCPDCGVEVARVKPLRRDSACLKCCRSHNRGRYDARFRFVRLPAK